MESELPADVRAFVAKHIASLEELEVLLLLHEYPERDWTAAEINERLRSQEVSIAQWLEALATSRFASVVGGRYRFAVPDEPSRARVAAVAEAYRSRRTKVIEFLFSKSNESLLSFVRAFELRRKS